MKQVDKGFLKRWLASRWVDQGGSLQAKDKLGRESQQRRGVQREQRGLSKISFCFGKPIQICGRLVNVLHSLLILIFLKLFLPIFKNYYYSFFGELKQQLSNSIYIL